MSFEINQPATFPQGLTLQGSLTLNETTADTTAEIVIDRNDVTSTGTTEARLRFTQSEGGTAEEFVIGTKANSTSLQIKPDDVAGLEMSNTGLVSFDQGPILTATGAADNYVWTCTGSGGTGQWEAPLQYTSEVDTSVNEFAIVHTPKTSLQFRSRNGGSITSITGLGTASTVITSADHGMVAGDEVTLNNVGGTSMVGLDGISFTISAADTNTFTIDGSGASGTPDNTGDWVQTDGGSNPGLRNAFKLNVGSGVTEFDEPPILTATGAADGKVWTCTDANGNGNWENAAGLSAGDANTFTATQSFANNIHLTDTDNFINFGDFLGTGVSRFQLKHLDDSSLSMCRRLSYTVSSTTSSLGEIRVFTTEPLDFVTGDSVVIAGSATMDGTWTVTVTGGDSFILDGSEFSVADSTGTVIYAGQEGAQEVITANSDGSVAFSGNLTIDTNSDSKFLRFTDNSNEWHVGCFGVDQFSIECGNTGVSYFQINELPEEGVVFPQDSALFGGFFTGDNQFRFRSNEANEVDLTFVSNSSNVVQFANFGASHSTNANLFKLRTVSPAQDIFTVDYSTSDLEYNVAPRFVEGFGYGGIPGIQSSFIEHEQTADNAIECKVRPFGAITNVSDDGGVIEITTSNHHFLETGDTVTIDGVEGVTAANGDWTVTRLDDSSFTLDTSVYSGTYTSDTGRYFNTTDGASITYAVLNHETNDNLTFKRNVTFEPKANGSDSCITVSGFEGADPNYAVVYMSAVNGYNLLRFSSIGGTDASIFNNSNGFAIGTSQFANSSAYDSAMLRYNSTNAIPEMPLGLVVGNMVSPSGAVDLRIQPESGNQGRLQFYQGADEEHAIQLDSPTGNLEFKVTGQGIPFEIGADGYALFSKPMAIKSVVHDPTDVNQPALATTGDQLIYDTANVLNASAGVFVLSQSISAGAEVIIKGMALNNVSDRVCCCSPFGYVSAYSANATNSSAFFEFTVTTSPPEDVEVPWFIIRFSGADITGHSVVSL